LLVTNVPEVLLNHVSRIVPNYDLAPDLGQVDILRVVVKENFAEALLDRLVCDIVRIRAPCCHCPRSTIGR
jgi:glutamate decarboxylase